MSARTPVAVVVDGTRFRTEVQDGQPVRIGAPAASDVHVPPAAAVPDLTVTLVGGGLSLDAGEHGVVTGPVDGPPVGLRVGAALVEARCGRPGARTVYDLRGRDQVVVGPALGADLTCPTLALTARRHADGWEVDLLTDDLFVDDVRVPAGRVLLRAGDHVGSGAYDLVLLDDELHVDEALVTAARLPRRPRSAAQPPPGYPEVRRSPRLVHRPPEGTAAVDAAPTSDDKRTGQLAKLVVPPLVMLAVTVGTSLMNGNALLVVATGATAVVTLVFSVLGYRKDRRRAAEDREAEEDAYREHLDARAVEVDRAAERQRHGALYHHPDVSTLLTMVTAYSPRVFEKAPTHTDFLCYRLGLGTVPAAVPAEYADQDRVPRGTELDALARHLAASTAELDRMPVTVDLRDGPVGYVGPRRLVVEQLRLLVDQLAFFHSHHDVQLVVVHPPEEAADWAPVRWYRHATLSGVNLRGFVHDQRSRDQVLTSLNQVLRARQQARGEQRAGTSTVFTPHLVVLVLDETLVMDHVVMEILREDPTDLGCSVVVVHETMAGLAESVTTVIDVRDRDTGVLVLQRGEVVGTRFALDHYPRGFDPEALPRAVGALRHVQDLRSSIPETVTFLGLYDVERVADLDVRARWAANSPHRTLGVPLGLRGPGDVVRLDLHEKAHGPHGLVAGTTGSGKSEIIQSYILSLAVCFHPHDVAFLLIDYKGGGMANLFADLPHLLGTITNLDGAQSMRALVSINAELKRRQRVFAAHDVNHINQYQKLVTTGDATEPMPHLFLISDEFAELKSEQPEFMDELISTARIGRSLGIHLILATQKPSGVVNDQIWSNSKFKLALKVADRSDSMEIIKTPDAAEITLPGRAYLQVGNNEIYELFQSAWSGADYEPDKQDNHQEDHAIYAINDLGQHEILTQDLSGLDGADEVRQIATELEAVVAEVARTARDADVTPVARPWLPPLPARIVLTDLHPADWPRAWEQPKAPLQPVIGTVDVPSAQTQETLRLDLTGDGHLAVFASPGYGKSTFLQTLVMDLARTHSPEHLHVYLLDLGTNGLLPLRGLPHVADTVTVEDVVRAQKLAARVDAEIRRRKAELSQHAVADLAMFERASGQVLPHVLLVADGFDGMKDSPVEEILTGLVTTVARDGAALGIHVVLTAGRSAALRGPLLANIKTQVALRLNADGAARDIVGRTSLVAEDLPGRGLIRLDQPEVFHTALPAPGDDALAVIEAIQVEARAMAAAWTGTQPESLPVVPETLTPAELAARPGSEALVARGLIPVGLDLDSVDVAGIDPVGQRQVLVLRGDAVAVGRTISQLWDAGGAAFPGGAFVLDDRAGNLGSLVRRTRPPGSGTTPVELLDAALAELDARQQAFRTALDGPEPPTLADHARTLERALVVLGDAAAAQEQVGEDRSADLLRLLTEGPSLAMPVLLGGMFATAGKASDAFGRAVKQTTAGLVGGALGDQSVLKAGNVPRNAPAPAADEAYLVADGRAVQVKLPTPP